MCHCESRPICDPFERNPIGEEEAGESVFGTNLWNERIDLSLYFFLCMHIQPFSLVRNQIPFHHHFIHLRSSLSWTWSKSINNKEIVRVRGPQREHEVEKKTHTHMHTKFTVHCQWKSHNSTKTNEFPCIKHDAICCCGCYCLLFSANACLLFTIIHKYAKNVCKLFSNV